MKKYEITRATVVKDNMPIETYDVNDVIDADKLHAYKEKIMFRYAHDVCSMDVDLVYKEIDA